MIICICDFSNDQTFKSNRCTELRELENLLMVASETVLQSVTALLYAKAIRSAKRTLVSTLCAYVR